MSSPRIININELPWTRWVRSEQITVDVKDPARAVGSSVCGLRLERLAPGKQASPPHRHHLQEELFLILRGSGILRHSDQEISVREGDFILYLAGDPASHTFVNTGAEPLEFIATGNRVSYEVCEYPEERTVYVEALGKLLQNDEAVEAGGPMPGWRVEPPE
jgi:uncharacterized cupin superfamily protein